MGGVYSGCGAIQEGILEDEPFRGFSVLLYPGGDLLRVVARLGRGISEESSRDFGVLLRRIVASNWGMD